MLFETGEPEGQHLGARAVYTARLWKAALCTPLFWKLSEGGLTLGPQLPGLTPCTRLLLLWNALLAILPAYDLQF